MSLEALVSVLVRARQTGSNDLSNPAVDLNKKYLREFADGAGAGQANKLFTDRRQLAASASESLDLAGGLTDGLGATLTFAEIKGLLIQAHESNANTLLIGGAASNAFINWVADATDVMVLKPGGLLLLLAPDAAGYAVTPGTGDLLKIANGGGSTAVDYDIIIIGD